MRRYFPVQTREVKVMIHFFLQFNTYLAAASEAIRPAYSQRCLQGKYIKYWEVVNYKPSLVCLTMDIFLYFSDG